jgi:hypothetical protein
MYRELLEEGRLEAFVKGQADQASQLLSDRIGAGVPHDQAWEEASQTYLYLPTEEGVPQLGEDARPLRVAEEASRAAAGPPGARHRHGAAAGQHAAPDPRPFLAPKEAFPVLTPVRRT